MPNKDVTKLAQMRAKRGMSQTELAKSAEVPVRQIRALEQRSRDIKNLNLMSAYKIAVALNCNIVDLIEDVDKQNMIIPDNTN